MTTIRCLIFLLILSPVLSQAARASHVIVSTPEELKKEVARAAPGDTILLEDKVWNNAALVLNGKGTAEHPILIMPQTAGGVQLSGNSYVAIGGEYLIVKGFHFKNGYTPVREVISFRINNDVLANHCRVTETVIEDFSQPDRFQNDVWVVLWGQHNRVDHCTFVDKLNAGPVLIAELNDARSQHNRHSVDSNYFKGRQRFGSNGGETIRIGVSRYSLTASETQIVHNYFEKCNGEVEIISIKSGKNRVAFNTFYECEGSVVLRHGSENIVQGNLFLGNEKPFTGGVRVVNPGHRIFDNVFKDLRGTGFRSALAVMNGVPNSLINRYYQVRDASIVNNTFINSPAILFGTGKDAERTLAPENVSFSNNLIISKDTLLFEDANQDGGIHFKNNGVVNTALKRLPAGFTRATVSEMDKDGWDISYSGRYGAELKNAAFSWIKKEAAGAPWYKPVAPVPIRKSRRFELSAADNKSLPELVKEAVAGDSIVLIGDGLYSIDEEIIVREPITIMAAPGSKQKPVLVSTSFKTLPAFITIENGGSLNVSGLAFKGSHESYAAVRAGIRSTDKPMNRHYKVFIDNCEFYDYNESTFAGFKGSKSTLADTIVITRSLFRNISGTGINLAEEKEDRGIYNAEYTIIRNCVFSQILGAAINIYRGGNDESTVGPMVTIDHCVFSEVENREQGTVVRLAGAQQASVTNSIFVRSGQGGRSIEFREFRWDKIRVDYCNFYQSGRIESFYKKVPGKHVYTIQPEFTDPAGFDFRLKPGSPLADKSENGGPLGIQGKPAAASANGSVQLKNDPARPLSGIGRSSGRQSIQPGFILPSGTEYSIRSASELNDLKLVPGDKVIMEGESWKDQRLSFRGRGTSENPIVLTAAAPGKTILSGNSTLKIDGEWLVADGLVFKNGYSEKESVVTFSKTSSHCRLTNTTITDFNPPDKKTDYKWVSLYGTHNRVDHCNITGKTHQGTTLVVWLDERPNYHRIDHNYFGPRPDLGANGGETIRIGTSDWSMHDSYTTVEYNVFDRCNGEIEIISIKSGHNTIRHNLFYECVGTVTFRHGNNSEVSNNYFIGHKLKNTGGIRVIGEGQKVLNNYLEGLAGTDLRSAIAIMNTVEQPKLNEYFQVKNAVITGNIIVDCAEALVIGAGKNDIRKLAPDGLEISRNYVLKPGKLVVYSDQPKNLVMENNQVRGATPQKGFSKIQAELVRKDKIWQLKSDQKTPFWFGESIGPSWEKGLNISQRNRVQPGR